jgi:hypothetical protein
VKLSWAQAPPICAPRKQLVQLKTGTGAANIAKSAAKAGAAMSDDNIAALANGSFFHGSPLIHPLIF